jgi:hypothetical protein
MFATWIDRSDVNPFFDVESFGHLVLRYQAQTWSGQMPIGHRFVKLDLKLLKINAEPIGPNLLQGGVELVPDWA